MIQAKSISAPKKSSQTYIIATAFLSLFAIVGFALYGLPFFYDFFSKEFGWSRTVVTSGNAILLPSEISLTNIVRREKPPVMTSVRK